MAKKLRQLQSKFNAKLSKCYSTTAESPIIKLPIGTVQGRARTGIYGHQYLSFEGIPYGQPPIGNLRFKAPQPALAWNCLWDCSKESNVPVQVERSTGEVVGAEDCLYLNVYTKTLKSAKPLPVMVYIYGGAFRTGGAISSKYGPDYLMREDIVYVIFNYRLGVLGFLSLNKPKLGIPGNAGLKDQVLALKWVKRYISHFNGDSDNITVFGESAGAASVQIMLSTSQTCGLFHKAILMSGSMLNPWVEASITRDYACQLAMQHGYKDEYSQSGVLKLLEGLSHEKLMTHNLLNDYETIAGRLSAFVPVVEPYKSDHTVIDKPYLAMMHTAWSNHLPVLIGGTSFEGLNMYAFFKQNPKFLVQFKKPMMLSLPREVFGSNKQLVNELYSRKLIRQHELDVQDNLLNVLDFYSHKLFWHGIHRTVLSRLAVTKAPTYMYRFDFDSPTFNFSRINMCGDAVKKGVAHADDMGYIFHKSNAWKLDSNSMEYRTIQRMVSILTSFAKTGNPNCEETSSVCWQPVTVENPYCALNISNELKFMDLPEKNTLELWHSIYKGCWLSCGRSYGQKNRNKKKF